MHEVGLVAAAIAQAVEAAQAVGATRVRRLAFAIDSRGHVTRETVEMLVAVLGRGTLVEGARVDVEVAPERLAVPSLVLISIDAEVPDGDGRQQRDCAIIRKTSTGLNRSGEGG